MHDDTESFMSRFAARGNTPVVSSGMGKVIALMHPPETKPEPKEKHGKCQSSQDVPKRCSFEVLR